MLELSTIVSFIKYLVFCSVVFVWVVRYKNIVDEFIQFGYPSWLRDFVGILKLTFVVLIINSEPALVKLGSSGICLLMSAALVTHIKIKNPFHKMVPAMSLFILSAIIFKSTIS
jgi:hypothetical protein